MAQLRLRLEYLLTNGCFRWFPHFLGQNLVGDGRLDSARQILRAYNNSESFLSFPGQFDTVFKWQERNLLAG
jgi:hypothetical protein